MGRKKNEENITEIEKDEKIDKKGSEKEVKTKKKKVATSKDKKVEEIPLF